MTRYQAPLTGHSVTQPSVSSAAASSFTSASMIDGMFPTTALCAWPDSNRARPPSSYVIGKAVVTEDEDWDF